MVKLAIKAFICSRNRISAFLSAFSFIHFALTNLRFDLVGMSTLHITHTHSKILFSCFFLHTSSPYRVDLYTWYFAFVELNSSTYSPFSSIFYFSLVEICFAFFMFFFYFEKIAIYQTWIFVFVYWRITKNGIGHIQSKQNSILYRIW